MKNKGRHRWQQQCDSAVCLFNGASVGMDCGDRLCGLGFQESRKKVHHNTVNLFGNSDFENKLHRNASHLFTVIMRPFY